MKTRTLDRSEYMPMRVYDIDSSEPPMLCGLAVKDRLGYWNMNFLPREDWLPAGVSFSVKAKSPKPKKVKP